ncbi:hypothetical protein [Haloferula sp. BvORR071]|uniref:hypothetical protein n=1 Tax=Haloferula sp. BvORR071 TaxID=1396141 RepID=UPI00055003E9|nr:hypothetical protein [Haloferula sp. BvORR071]
MFGNLKDSLASSAAKSLLSARLERYGRVTELRIRSKEKTLLLQVMLAGEHDEVTIEVGRYRIVGLAGNHTIIVESVRASREWLQLALEDFVVGKPFPIPTVALVALGGADGLA